MSLLELILISIGLAMDCFAVSFSAGAHQKNYKIPGMFIVAAMFGLFQAGMPLIGWAGGEAVVDHICQFDHWIAFLILAFIGGNMLKDGIRPDKEDKAMDVLKPVTLLVLSVATSIDALAVGFSFSMMDVNIWLSVFCIGMASFFLSMTGSLLGQKVSEKIKPQYAEILGGIILIIIGLTILLSHIL